MVVENIAGAGSNIAFDRVAKGPADGSQILIVPPGLATNQFLYPKLAFDPATDFTPLALVATFPNLLCVRNSLPVNTMAELIAYAKANPGKLNYGSTGIGTTPHLASEMLKRMAGIDFATVHYRGSAPAVNRPARRGRRCGDRQHHLDRSACPRRQRQGARHLDAARWPLAPEFVPIADTLPGYEALAFSGIAVRAGTPREICDSIETAVKAICKEPVLKSECRPAGGGGGRRGAGVRRVPRGRAGQMGQADHGPQYPVGN